MKPTNKASALTGCALILLAITGAATGHFASAILLLALGGCFLAGSATVTIIPKDAP